MAPIRKRDNTLGVETTGDEWVRLLGEAAAATAGGAGGGGDVADVVAERHAGLEGRLTRLDVSLGVAETLSTVTGRVATALNDVEAYAGSKSGVRNTIGT